MNRHGGAADDADAGQVRSAMRTLHAGVVRAGIALAGVVALTSCTGSLFQSKAAVPVVYLLSGAGAPAPVAPAALIPADVAVLPPRVRKGLDSDRIAVLYPDRRLDSFAGAKWSGPLDEVVQDLLVAALRASRQLRNVTTDASAFAGGYWLEVDVVDFEAEYPTIDASSPSAAPTIHIHLSARLGTAGERRIVGAFDADARQPAADNRLTGIVDAYERAVHVALLQIVAGTAAALGSLPGP